MTSKFDAVAFDMDGTLLDSMGYWRRMNTDFLAKHNLTAPEEIRADLQTMSSRVCAGEFAKAYDIGMTADDIMAEYRDYMKRYYETVIEPKLGAMAYVDQLHAQGIRTCVATAVPEELARVALGRHGFLEKMEFIASSFDLGLGKEDAPYFEYVAGRLSIDIHRVMMFEDAAYAMKGARKAGMQVYGIADPTQAWSEAECRALSDVFIQNYNQLLINQVNG